MPEIQSSILGIIYPLQRNHVSRFFDKKKSVYVKFVQGLPRRLVPGSRLFFYESGGNKEIVGEARILEVSAGNIEEVWSRFGHAIFLTRTELERYVGNRRTKKMLVLLVGRAERYATPLRLQKQITKGGRYMKSDFLRQLIDQNKSS